ncbi:hypothetical protein EGP91_01835, partial [bacterium]|nr:hypothetical protein [bacterium]
KAKGEEERQKLKEKWRTIMTMDEYMNALLSDEVMNEERSMFKKARDYGREEGINIGKIQGVDFVARNLLKETNDINYISKVTGLTVKEVENLKQSA